MSIKVLIIDDSPLIRTLLTEIINKAPDMRVVGTAEDPFDGREKIKALSPDVITLDVEMPKMNGISFLKNLMRLRPMPVVMISTLTEEGAPVTLQALEIGAIDYVAKPKTNVMTSLLEYSETLHEKIRTAASANVVAQGEKRSSAAAPSISGQNYQFKSNHIIAIGASTGGTEAIKEVLKNFPTNCPPVVIAQHIPPVFSSSYAKRLNAGCQIEALEAENNMRLKHGVAYIAPGDAHLEIKKEGGFLYTQLKTTPPVNRHRPSVDVLFDSVAATCGKFATGAILTGMGADGARGLKHMLESGARTLAQDEKSSVVFGMPKAAIDMDAAEQVCSLNKMCHQILLTCCKS